jgi:signal-transduction protein with cAMP-binding, CBS, and nucleotidyltransferase domain
VTGLVAIAGADLRRVDLFDDLDDHALAVWAAAATVRRYAAGDVMVGQGECVRGLELLLEGTARSVIRDGNRRKPVACRRADVDERDLRAGRR